MQSPIQPLTESRKNRLATNLAAIRERIDHAARAAGRRGADVRLVAVTKEVPEEVITALLELGIDAIGENRPEIIWKKQAAIPEPVPWHMIGHFQRNKIDRALPHIHMVHSVHSMDLLGSLDARLGRLAARSPLPVLLQINVSGEISKQGFRLEEAPHAADLAGALNRLKFSGFMTMAPADANDAQLHEIFGRLRELRESVGRDRAPELSMGMSSDFEVAVEEGATMVRIGSALFGGLDFER